MVEMSAQQNLGVDDLLEQLNAVAELEELTVNPTGRAKGVVLEAKLDIGRGPVATVLVDKGTLKVGDPIVAGAAWGKVRALINDRGEQVKEAGPLTRKQLVPWVNRVKCVIAPSANAAMHAYSVVCVWKIFSVKFKLVKLLR